jgi:hypothetical protein
MLYGTCVVQWYNYYTSGYNDPLFTRCARFNVRHVTGSIYPHPPRLLVFWCMVLDTFHTATTVYMLWDFAVDHFGKYDIYHELPWTYSTTPIFS